MFFFWFFFGFFEVLEFGVFQERILKYCFVWFSKIELPSHSSTLSFIKRSLFHKEVLFP